MPTDELMARNRRLTEALEVAREALAAVSVAEHAWIPPHKLAISATAALKRIDVILADKERDDD